MKVNIQGHPFHKPGDNYTLIEWVFLCIRRCALMGKNQSCHLVMCYLISSFIANLIPDQLETYFLNNPKVSISLAYILFMSYIVCATRFWNKIYQAFSRLKYLKAKYFFYILHSKITTGPNKYNVMSKIKQI